MKRGDIVEYVDCNRFGVNGMAGSIGVVVDTSLPSRSYVRWIVKNVEMERYKSEKELGADLHENLFLKVIGHADQ